MSSTPDFANIDVGGVRHVPRLLHHNVPQDTGAANQGPRAVVGVRAQNILKRELGRNAVELPFELPIHVWRLSTVPLEEAL